MYIATSTFPRAPFVPLVVARCSCSGRSMHLRPGKEGGGGHVINREAASGTTRVAKERGGRGSVDLAGECCSSCLLGRRILSLRRRGVSSLGLRRDVRDDVRLGGVRRAVRHVDVVALARTDVHLERTDDAVLRLRGETRRTDTQKSAHAIEAGARQAELRLFAVGLTSSVNSYQCASHPTVRGIMNSTGK